MADGDLYIHVQPAGSTITIGSGSAGTVEPKSTAGTIKPSTAGRPE